MDFVQLRYFQTVAKLENITRAAQELNMTQPSLSKAIARLEESFGVQLFDRDGKKIRLNNCGKALLRHVEQLFIEIDDTQKELEDMSSGDRGSISVGAYQLGRLQEPTLEFLMKHPLVKMRQIQMSAQEMRPKLENGEIDFAISIVPIETVNILWEPVMTERFGILLPRNHRLADRKTVKMEELKDEPFIINNGTPDIAMHLQLFCERAGFSPNVIFEGSQAALIDALVRAGNGICLLPQDLYQYRDTWASVLLNPEQEPRLVRISGKHSTLTIGIAMLKNRYLSVAATEFVNFLREYFIELDESIRRFYGD